MFNFKSYFFWLIVVSLLCLIAERFAPWRKKQPLFRPQFAQDCFWLVFNGYLAAIVFKIPFKYIYTSFDTLFTSVFGNSPQVIKFISGFPLIAQIVIALVVADFIEWCVHNMLHRNAWLWKIHRIHHSIKVMDWIGNFRFHWGELFVYKTIKYLPLALLGARWEAVLITAVISTTIGHINHSNLNITWGPLRYIFNSPRMHIWHHEKKLRGKAGVNFAVVFSFWDYLFGTAYMPGNSTCPEIGFGGEKRLYQGLLGRFFLPMFERKIVKK